MLVPQTRPPLRCRLGRHVFGAVHDVDVRRCHRCQLELPPLTNPSDADTTGGSSDELARLVSGSPGS